MWGWGLSPDVDCPILEDLGTREAVKIETDIMHVSYPWSASRLSLLHCSSMQVPSLDLRFNLVTLTSRSITSTVSTFAVLG